MFAISSPAFVDDGSIPKKYTSEGDNVSPPIEWSALPRNLQQLCADRRLQDPACTGFTGVGQRTWVHWVLYDISNPRHTPCRQMRPVGRPWGTPGAQRLETDRLRRSVATRVRMASIFQSCTRSMCHTADFIDQGTLCQRNGMRRRRSAHRHHCIMGR